MKLILDSKLEQEMIDRFAYMYDVFHTYMLVNKKTDYYIEYNKSLSLEEVFHDFPVL